MVGDGDDADFSAYAFRAPGEVAGVEAEGTEFLVAAADAYQMDTLGADTGIGRLATLFEGSREDCQWFGPGDLDGGLASSFGSRHALHLSLTAYDASLVRYP